MKHDVVVLVPIYKPELDQFERYSLDQSVKALSEREIRFIAPDDLDVAFYLNNYPQAGVERFSFPNFKSIQEYNRLLLSLNFYERYLEFEFVLILQTDAIILQDDLDYWCKSSFDYVGAPWPVNYKLFVNTDRFEGDFGKNVNVGVGNGGLSLRRIDGMRRILNEFPVEVDVFKKTGSSEDLFFSVMGSLSKNFLIPNEITASLFSMEGRPSYYFHVNGNIPPMGGHAWWKNEPEFWRKLLPGMPVFDGVK